MIPSACHSKYNLSVIRRQLLQFLSISFHLQSNKYMKAN